MDPMTSDDREWSLTSSSRDIEIGRSERNSASLKVSQEDGIGDKSAIFSNSAAKKKDLSGRNGINAGQLEVLRDFLFTSLAPPDGRFQKSVSNGLLVPSDSTESGLGVVFETTFNLTEDRLKRLFNLFDGNDNGTITYEDLKLGFTYHATEPGMPRLDDQDFLGLVMYLDSDQSGEITFEEFSEGIRLLMLRSILQQVAHSDRNKYSVLTEVFDYNSINLEQYLLKGISQLKQPNSSSVSSKPLLDFFLHEREDDVSVRWINITGRNASNILKMMALKYRLHPLALEDALECSEHRPKADSYDGHYFIMVPVFYLKDADNSAVNTGVQEKTKRHWCDWIFRKNNNQNEKIPTVTTTATDDESVFNSTDESAENKFIGVHMTSIFMTMPHGRTVITFNNEIDEEKSWHKLQYELKKDYSKLRQYDGQFLAYSLLDQSVDKIGDIVKKLKEVIKKEKKIIADSNYRNLDRIHLLKHELELMSRKFKPFLRLLVHVIEDDSFSPGATIYLRDVLDNLEIHDDDVKNLVAKCDSVDLEFEKRQQKQMDATLYTLTVISAVFLPAQFFTGVWGMNFEGMPLLKQSFGYPFFWGLAVGTMAITLCLLNFGRHPR